MFSREENTWSLSTAGVRAADCRTQVLHRGRGHSQLPTLQRSWGKQERWSLKQALKSHRSHSDTCTWDRNWGSSQPVLGQPKAQSSPALSPLPHRGCDSPSSASPGVTDPAANTALPAGHSCNTNTPALPAPSKEQQVLTAACPVLSFSGKSLI